MIKRILVQSNFITGCFSDDTIVQLSRNGEYFSIPYSRASTGRQNQGHYFRTKFALSSQQLYVTPVLKFVNMYIENDRVSTILDSNSRKQTFKRDSRLDFVDWPLSFDEIQKNKQINGDGSIRVSSPDQLCHLTLSPHSQSFMVTYPTLFNQDANKFEYIWINQVYSIRWFPPRWEFPLLCALLIYLKDENGEKWESILLSNEYCQSNSITPKNRSLFTEDCCRTESCMIVSLPHSKPHNVQLPPPFKLDPFIFSHSSYSREHKTLLEWTEKALYRILPQTNEVEVSIFEDDSFLLTQQNGELFYHHTSNECQIYSKNDLFDFPYTLKAKGYSLTEFAATALRLLESNSTIQEPVKVETLQPTNEVIEEKTVEKVGLFTAYKNGNVRVRFFDRTILDLFGTKCKIITRDAREVLFTTTLLPQECEPYVSHAVEFREWVSLTLEQKINLTAQEEHLKFDCTANIVTEHLNSTRRFIDVYKIRNGK
eukprot:TRINITY_DN3391_c0_g1_i4.p1 TRINITY_DN3391_c0_g1~~TRINITY_DN3391_c0_g1_i4.p1  ORF type:complete len:507 (+),score=60.59 TRINITY_DN3391_c0_g1_i4:71-1522(+)